MSEYPKWVEMDIPGKGMTRLVVQSAAEVSALKSKKAVVREVKSAQGTSLVVEPAP